MVIVLCVLAGVWAWSIADVIATNLGSAAPTKGAWIAAVMGMPVVGAAAWLLRGRPVQPGWALGDIRARPYGRVIRSGAALSPTSRRNAWWADE